MKEVIIKTRITRSKDYVYGESVRDGKEVTVKNLH